MDTKYETGPLKVEDALAPNCFGVMAKVPVVPPPFVVPFYYFIFRGIARCTPRQLEITEIILAFKSGTTVRDVAKL